MIITQNIWQQLVDLANNDIFNVVYAGIPVNGTSGTGVGICGPGSYLYDSVNKNMYQNAGTLASPTWIQLSINNTAIKGSGPIAFAKAQYDFSVDGGAVSTITPTSNTTIPANAIILGGIIDVLTTFTSGGSATIAVGTSAGSSTTSLKAATAVATYTAGLLAVVPVFTAATMVKLTAAGQITLTIGTAALTDGKANVIVAYLQSN